MTTNLPCSSRSFLGSWMLVIACVSGCGAPPSSKVAHTPSSAAVPNASARIAEPAGPTESSAAAVLPVSDADPQLGSSAALVTIVEFTDFECPFCSRVVPTLKQIREAYPDDVRIVLKHLPLPFHKRARASADAANTVFALGGNAAFWKFHDLVFANQSDLSDGQLEKLAVEAGVDGARFRAAFSARAQVDKVDADLAVAAKIGVTGTPGFRINGAKLSGAQPFDAFKEIIELELAAARQLVASGVKREDVYKMRTDAQLELPRPEAPLTSPPPDTTVWKVPVQKDDPVRGKRDAPVTIVVFSDFQCPFCKRVEDTLAGLLEKYGDKIRIVWKDNPLPFHPRAKPAAQLARFAYARQGDAGFWKVHDALFASLPALEEDDLKLIAQKSGLPWLAAKEAIDKEKFRDRIEASMDLANGFEARGTPHFFINGRRLAGAQPSEAFEALIDEQLAKAEALVASGVAKGAVYDAVTKDGKLPPPPEKKEVAVDPTRPFRGPANAKIVIQEFSDFQCPYCKRVQETLHTLERDFPGQIKLVHRHLPLPFHSFAALAAEAAEEAFEQKGNAGFWRYHDALFEAQGTPDGLARPSLEKIAGDIGLDLPRFRAALDSRKHGPRVAADAAAAGNAGIEGTPGFVINGYFLGGAYPPAAFKKLIRLALADSKAAAPVRDAKPIASP